MDFGDKTQEVSTTALRLVQRMKRDSLHSGRRPSGLCGAALLLAARLHEFNREPTELVKIVKVHESTLRKRMLEFGDTPSGALTLDEFLTVDLEEEQDPPAFIAARKKDRERLKKLSEKEGEIVLTHLQKEIEMELEKDNKKKTKMPKKPHEETIENMETQKFVLETTLGVVQSTLEEQLADDPASNLITNSENGLGPDLASMGILTNPDILPTMDAPNVTASNPDIYFGICNETLEDVDDDEIDSIIMSSTDVLYKSQLWHKLNENYLLEQKMKAEKLAKEKEEGKPEKKKKKTGPKKKNVIGPSTTAGEAIEKMLQEKKISSKINYDILMSLNKDKEKVENNTQDNKELILASSSSNFTESPDKRRKNSSISETPIVLTSPISHSYKRSKLIKPVGPTGLPDILSPQPLTPQEIPKQINLSLEDDAESEYYEEDVDLPDKNTAPEMESISQLLRSQDDDNDDYAFEEY